MSESVCRPLFFFVPVLAVVMVASCASETTVTQSQVKKDIWGHDEAYSVGQDEDGNPVMKSDRRSGFENKQSNIATNRDFSGKDYTSQSYRKKRWGGDTSFGRKKYQGNTKAQNYSKDPWFVQKQANVSNRQPTEVKKSFFTNPFRSKKKSAKSYGTYSTGGNAQINNRRNTYKQPSITGWKDQKGLSVRDTNSMLGR